MAYIESSKQGGYDFTSFLQRNSGLQMLFADLRIRLPIVTTRVFSRKNNFAMPGFLLGIYEQLCQCFAW